MIGLMGAPVGFGVGLSALAEFLGIKLANPATLPTSTGYGASFSSDGIYLAVAHYASPFVTIYKRAGDVFTKLANPATLPTEAGNGASFSSDGAYLSVGHDSSPFVTIYK